MISFLVMVYKWTIEMYAAPVILLLVVSVAGYFASMPSSRVRECHHKSRANMYPSLSYSRPDGCLACNYFLPVRSSGNESVS